MNIEQGLEAPQTKEKPTGRRVCAWCNKEMGEAKGLEGITTHTMCPDCEKLMEKEIEQLEKEQDHG